MFSTNSIISLALCFVPPMLVVFAERLGPFGHPEIWVGVGILSLLAAAFFGHAGRRKIRKCGHAPVRGFTMATAGLTIAYLELAVSGTAFFLTIPHSQRSAHCEASAVGSLRTLNFAAQVYADTHRRGGFPKALKDLSGDGSQSQADWMIDQVLASGTKEHYRFTFVAKSTKPGGRIDAYQIYADPIDARDRECRHFFTSESGAIRMSKSAPANESSTELK